MTDSVYRFKNEDFVLREVGNELVLVPLVNNIFDMTNVMTLNEVASEILKALDGETSVNEIYESLFLKFEVEKNTLEKDILNFIESAKEKKIIELM